MQRKSFLQRDSPRFVQRRGKQPVGEAEICAETIAFGFSYCPPYWQMTPVLKPVCGVLSSTEIQVPSLSMKPRCLDGGDDTVGGVVGWLGAHEANIHVLGLVGSLFGTGWPYPFLNVQNVSCDHVVVAVPLLTVVVGTFQNQFPSAACAPNQP